MIEQLGQLQDLVDTVADVTGCPVTLEDRDLNLVASSGHEDVIDAVRRATILRRRSGADVQLLFATFGIARATRPLRIPGDVPSERMGRWCLPVRWRQVTYGYVWLLDPDDAVPRATIDGLGDVVDQAAALLALRSQAAERVTWAAGGLMSDDAGVRARALDELRGRGALSRTGNVSVVALAPRHEGTLGPVNSWLLPRGVVAAPVGGHAALLVPAAPTGAAGSGSATRGAAAAAHGGAAFAASVAAKVAHSLLAQHVGGVAAGISGQVDPAEAHLGWRQAGTALEVARGRRGDSSVEIADWAALGVRRLLALADASTLATTLSDDRLERLTTLDAHLIHTARTYLELGTAATATAQRLSIHRQTLYQRLARIEELTGLDLSAGEDRALTYLFITFFHSP
ncbi:PucR family transcriptional regulator [Cryptosporangium sp. NPDC048952]|uniref:PucR family transcriptional regulator n=1 Tax=Cryptosporangium sp. NPDC048952 TaxID=3363961 RepID=UPI003712F007